MAVLKQISVKLAKKKAWSACSRYVRFLHADEYGLCQCVTCGTTLPWENMQAGHFIPGRNNAILYDIRGIHPQCYNCNINLKGNPRKYDAFMEERYGNKVILELDRLSDTQVQMKAYEHLEVRDKFEKLFKELEASRTKLNGGDR